MVDENLLKELNKLIDSGLDFVKIDDTLKVFEFFKQISKENEDLSEELEDIEISIQFVIKDIRKLFWLAVKNNKLNYGEGNTTNPSFSLTTTARIFIGILFGEIDLTSAYMAGDIEVEGNLQDAMAFQEIIELALEAFNDIIFDEIEKEEKKLITDLQEIKKIKFDQKDLVAIEVNNILFENHYEFDLVRNNLPLIILHGLNGCGKTTLLKIIYFLLTKQYYNALGIKFFQIIFKFKNNTNLSFRKIRNNISVELIKDNVIISKIPLIKSIKDYKRKISPSDIRDILNKSSNWVALDLPNDFPYLNRKTRKILGSIREAYTHFMKYPYEFNLDLIKGSTFDIGIDELNTYFIQTNRLESLETISRGLKTIISSKISRYRTRKYDEKTKERYNPLMLIQMDLKTRIEKVTEKSNSISRKFDSEFFDLLLKKVKVKKDLKKSEQLIDELKNDLNRISDIEEELMQLGLYEFPIGDYKRTKEIVNQDPSIIAELYDALVVFNDGLKEKFQIFDYIKQKIRLFYEFSNNHIKGKNLKVSREQGFQFITTDNIIIEPWELSSGEQHLIFLAYFLIFLAEPNSLVLIDEPEISLHLKWQRSFITDILNLSKDLKLKFILATHSPAIIGDYNQQMLKMEIME